MKVSGWLFVVLAGGVLTVLPGRAQDAQPMMDSEYWVNIGAFFPRRNSAASAGVTPAVDSRDTDFEPVLGMKDDEELGMLGLGWRFGEKWALSTQYFELQRSSRSTVRADIEWEDV